jgi:ABC-type branched-subunit amino acid transport system substrate-binding protein
MRRSMLRHLALVGVLALVVSACPDDEADVEDTEETPAEDTEAEDIERDEDQLHIGYILPETGQLAFLGPPQISSVEMAVEEANDAGGVLGNDVQLSTGDEAGDTAVASQSADRLLAEGVHAIIGAAASGMSLAIIDQVTGAGTVQCSASNTAPTFTDYEDDGYYFRTAPSDMFQGQVLAELLADDGHEEVAVLARADDYGRGLMDALVEDLEAAGGSVGVSETYDPEATTFDAEVTSVADADPDAVVLIAFEEGVQIIQAMIEQGLGPDEVALYGADGLASSELNEDVDPGNPEVLDGMKGTNPAAEEGVRDDFLQRLDEFNPDLGETTVFAAQAYDCTMMVMLATEAAGTADPEQIRENMLEITQGDNECTSFEECRGLLEDGETIAYQFASGITALTDVGEPADGAYDVWEWTGADYEGSVEVRTIQDEDAIDDADADADDADADADADAGDENGADEDDGV